MNFRYIIIYYLLVSKGAFDIFSHRLGPFGPTLFFLRL